MVYQPPSRAGCEPHTIGQHKSESVVWYVCVVCCGVCAHMSVSDTLVHCFLFCSVFFKKEKENMKWVGRKRGRSWRNS